MLRKSSLLVFIIIALILCWGRSAERVAGFDSSELKQVVEKTGVVNVAVPVRVYEGSEFVENLTISDFEIYEDGVLQKIEALYLIRKTNIERKEELQKFDPALSKHYYLFFQMTDYDPKLKQTIDYLFNNVIQPSDTLSIWTPVRSYNLSKDALQKISKEEISKEMNKILKKDIVTGSLQYKDLLRKLGRDVRDIQQASGFGTRKLVGEDSSTNVGRIPLESMFHNYRATLQEMEKIRTIDEKGFIRFAEILKKEKKEKIVFFFYQREFKPNIPSSTLNMLMSMQMGDSTVIAGIQELFNVYQRETHYDVNKISQAFADSGILFNFMYIEKRPPSIPGVEFKEQSEDFFKVFSEVADATGGTVDTSKNPAVGFENSVSKTDNYYLIYYSPMDYRSDGEFKKIEVKVQVKDKNYKLAHRQGYFAD